MRKMLMLACLLAIVGCRGAQRDPGTVVFLIESSPANLDPRMMMGMESQGMILAAHGHDGEPIVISPLGSVPPGSKIT